MWWELNFNVLKPNGALVAARTEPSAATNKSKSTSFGVACLVDHVIRLSNILVSAFCVPVFVRVEISNPTRQQCHVAEWHLPVKPASPCTCAAAGTRSAAAGEGDESPADARTAAMVEVQPGGPSPSPCAHLALISQGVKWNLLKPMAGFRGGDRCRARGRSVVVCVSPCTHATLARPVAPDGACVRVPRQAYWGVA